MYIVNRVNVRMNARIWKIFQTQQTWHHQTCMKDKALNQQKLNDDPRRTAKIVMKKTKYASQNVHTNMYSDVLHDM